MATRSRPLVLVLSSVLLAACSPPADPPPPAEGASAVAIQEGEPGGVYVETIEVSARVVGIDRETRTLTLMGPEGNDFPVEVGPQAVNFDQIEVGDSVAVALAKELVIAVAAPGAELEDDEGGAVALAPVGAKPSGIAIGTVRITGTVTAIDPEARTATLRFADGGSRTFEVRPDVDLSRREVGEQVVIQVTQSLAIAVRKQ